MVEIPSTKTVSDDVVVTVFPVTSQHKHTFCTKLGVSKGPNARHVYEPYTLNCSLGKQPKVTLDCGVKGTACTGAQHITKTHFSNLAMLILFVYVAGIYMMSQVS